MKIVVDSREQARFMFEKYEVDVMPGALATGDYSLPGLESLVAVAPADDQATRIQLLRLADLMRDVAGSIQIRARAE